MTLTSTWNCPTCKIPVSTLHCAMCGERPIDPRELTIAGMFRQLLRVFSSIDGRLIRSFRTLLRSPGALTTSYLAGQRRVYVRPLSLFLVTNVFFFAVQSLSSTSIVAPPLESHLQEQDWSAVASSLVAGQLEARQISLDQLTPLYDQAAILNAKSLVILMVLPFTLLTALPVCAPKEAIRSPRGFFAPHVFVCACFYIVFACWLSLWTGFSAATG